MKKFFLLKCSQLLIVQLGTLNEILFIINNKKISEQNKILNSCLISDMYDLKKQYQVALDHIKFSICRIMEIPLKNQTLHTNAILNFEFKIAESSILVNNLIAKIDKIDLEREISFIKDKRKFVFTDAVVYFQDWVIPNVYFHSAMVYAIARMSGINIGKSLFLSAKQQKSDIYKDLELFPAGGMIYNERIEK